MKKILFCSVLLCSFMYFTPTESFACTPNTGTPVGITDQVYFPSTDVAQNFRIVLMEHYKVSDRFEWEIETSPGQLEELAFEQDGSLLFGLEPFQFNAKIWKPVRQLEVGERVRIKDCTVCEWQTIKTHDSSAPSRPELAILDYYPELDLDDDCRFGFLGSLSLQVAPRQKASEPSLLVLVYVGSTPEMAQTSTQPLLWDELRADADTMPLRVNEALAAVAPESGFCFAIEFLDYAHNRSPRSDSLCWGGYERAPEEDASDMDTRMEPRPSPDMQSDMDGVEPTGDMMSSDGDNTSTDDHSEPTCATTWTPNKPTPTWLLFLLLGFMRSRHRHPRGKTTR